MARRPQRSTARGPRAGELLEAPWQAQIVQTGAFYGWDSYHTHDSRRSAPGFPDLVMVRADGPAAELLFVEVKADQAPARVTIAEAEARPEWLRHRDVTNDQAAWLERLAAVGAGVEDLLRFAAARIVVPVTAVEAHLWRPAMFDDVVHRRLAAGRHRLEPIDRPV